SPAAAPPAPTDEIHSETALEGPGSPVQASADTPDDVGPAVDVPPQVEAPRDATEPSTGATTATPGRSRSRPHATTTASAPPTPAPAPSAETPRTSPALEANPYLTP
ncbi:MAG: hypothetical protein K1X94_29000, partial [Sandaracinaceae bacterium]|nr:hypothetical protein [Sandaracinaceae bacterium]